MHERSIAYRSQLASGSTVEGMPLAVLGFSSRNAGTAGTTGVALLLMSRSGAQAPAAAKHCPLLQSKPGSNGRLQRVSTKVRCICQQVA